MGMEKAYTVVMLDMSKLILGAPNHEVRGAIRAGWFDGFLKVPANAPSPSSESTSAPRSGTSTSRCSKGLRRLSCNISTGES